MSDELVFQVKDLNVRFDTADGVVEAVCGLDLEVHRGETVAVVGESGSGKSQAMMAAMGLLAANGRAEGRAAYRGENLIGLPKPALDRIRGRHITMIFQEPMTSLDPLYPVGRQIAEPLRVHGGLSPRKARARALELLEAVQMPEPEARLAAFPHELSGGQRQRVMIAMALANDPDLLIADEPTTALDVTIQAEILALLADLQARHGMAILFITHDLGIVRAFADRVYVMRAGHVVEHGATGRLFAAPQADYTKMLLSAEPEGRKAPVAGDAAPVLTAEEVTVSFARPRRLLAPPAPPLRAVDSVSVSLKRGETVGIVGESGSGKSTFARAILQLLPSDGRVVFAGAPIDGLDAHAMRPHRRGLQIVFQDPYGALSPRMTVGEVIGEGLRVHAPAIDAKARAHKVGQALAEVGLTPAHRNRFPHEFSGGQRQRIAIARALVLTPEVLVLDEPTSALDRSVQKQIIALLRGLQETHGLAYLFISHDLAVVRAVADRVMVMKSGKVIEEGPTERIFAAPAEAYTQRLMRAAFDLDSVLADSSARRAAG